MLDPEVVNELVFCSENLDLVRESPSLELAVVEVDGAAASSSSSNCVAAAERSSSSNCAAAAERSSSFNCAPKIHGTVRRAQKRPRLSGSSHHGNSRAGKNRYRVGKGAGRPKTSLTLSDWFQKRKEDLALAAAAGPADKSDCD